MIYQIVNFWIQRYVYQLVVQHLNHQVYPLPFPIRDPKTFLVTGRCGNALNHNILNVLSFLRAAFFKKSLYRNICRLFIRKGCVSNKPIVPYISFLVTRWLNERRFCIFLYINFRGRNNNYKSNVLNNV